VRAATISHREAKRRIRSMRRRVREYDVARWAGSFLDAVQTAPERSQSAQPRLADRALPEGELGSTQSSSFKSG